MKPASPPVSPYSPPERPRPSGRTGGRAPAIAYAALNVGPLVILVLILLMMTLLSPYFFTTGNIQNLLVQCSVVALMGMGALYVLLARGIDISVGSMIGLSAVIGALLFNNHGWSGAAVVSIMVAVTASIGFINGFIYVKGSMPHPFIVTLGTLSVARGAAYVLSDGLPIPGMPEVIITLGAGKLGPLPVPAIVVVGAALVTLLLLQFTQWGRWIYAIGGNPEAAERTGIPVGRVLISTYVVGAVFIGIASILLAGRTAVGSPTAGQLLELDAIAAVVIGGASFLGGRGHVGHVLIGALTIGVIRNGMNLLSIDAFYQNVVLGSVTVLAVFLDVQRARLVNRLRLRRVLEAEGS